MKKFAACFLILFVSGLACLSVASTVDKKDTVEDVIKTGKLALPELDAVVRDFKLRAEKADSKTKEDLSQQISLLLKLRPLVVRIGQDRSFATKIFELAQKNDKTGLGDLLRGELAGIRLQVRELGDFYLLILVGGQGDGVDHTVCFCSSACCGRGCYHFCYK